jgi:hypothetical protein
MPEDAAVDPDAVVLACASDHDAGRVRSPVTPPSEGAIAFEITHQTVLTDHSAGALLRLVRSTRRWAITTPQMLASFSRDGTLVAPLVDLSRASGLAFSGTSLALTATNGGYDRQLLFFDEAAQSTGEPASIRRDLFPLDRIEDSIDVAWLSSRGAFVVASTDGDVPRPHVVIRVVGSDGTSLETLDVDPASEVERVRIAANDRQAFVILQQPTHILQGLLLGGNPVGVLAGPFDLLVHDGLGNATPTVFAYDDDRFLVAGFDGREVRISTVDTAACEGRAVQPRRVASTAIQDEPAGVAVVPEHEFYVVCYVVGASRNASDTPHQNVLSVQAVGDDGTLWGAPFSVVSDTDVDGVACGWDGEQVMVVWGHGCFSGCAPGATETALLRPTFL